MRIGIFGFILATLFAMPTAATTFAPETMKCPIGGKRFTYMAMMSTSTFGELPDGQPIGPGPNPSPLPQCPDNGLVVYKDFVPKDVKALQPYVLSAEYQGLRKTETPYYLAHMLSQRLNEGPQSVRLLLAATWEAKAVGIPEANDLAKRYMEKFVVLVSAQPADPSSFGSIALRARAVETLRELGRFNEAEDLRSRIVIAPDVGGNGPDGVENRAGWARFIDKIGRVIARKDTSRMPIDMMSDRQAAFRCVEPGRKTAADEAKPAPLTAFEIEYCQRPEIAAEVADVRKAGDD
jgi:hypothetical protein